MSAIYGRGAKSDLRNITRWFMKRSPEYAARITDELRERCRQLGVFPKMGKKREELATGLWSFSHAPYVIFYCETEDGVAIVRIIDGRQNITSEMFPA